MTEPVGLELHPQTQDVVFIEGSLAMVSGGEAIAQHAAQRVGTFRGEWFLDRTVGVAWLTDMMGKGFDTALASALVTGELAATPGVDDVVALTIDFDATTRGVNFASATIRTTAGDVVSLI